MECLSVREFYVFLFQFVTMCFILSYVPTQSRTAHVFILYKGKGNPLDPNSYRGISLTPILGKLYERILLSRLQDWSSTTAMSQLPQFGFRSKCSTTQAVFLLQTLVHEVVLLAKKPLYAIFVDLTKAFPSIDRDAMFRFLSSKGVPSHLLKAIRAFYVGNTAKLRVDNLLSVVINVTLGVLEGSCLSPFLFSAVFSVVWEFVTCSDFPSDRPRVLNLGEIWLIAFADDVVLLSTSATRLQEVLAKLFVELKTFNLCMNLVKTESLTFLPPRIKPNPVQFKIGLSVLNQIEEFKYLGIFVSSKWGFNNHVARMRGRAEAASSELLKLVTRLDVRDMGRVTVFFRALVESQWHGLELLPCTVVEEIESNRAHFVKKMFNLPSSTATNITIVLLDLWPASFEAMSRRISFARKMSDHDLIFVRDAFLFDRSLLRVKEGWHHDSFRIFQSMFKSEKVVDFSIDRVSARLSPMARSRTPFLFHLLKVSDEATLAPFRLFETVEVLISFRELLGAISKSSKDFLLLILTSGHRFRFFHRTALKCPLCSSSSWLTEHLFNCAMVKTLLARNGVVWEEFARQMGLGQWGGILFTLHEVMTIWKNTFETCILEDVIFEMLYQDARIVSAMR